MKSPIIYTEIPKAVEEFAHRMTHPMVTFYGDHIHSLTLQKLAASCYLQGIEDTINHIDRAKRVMEGGE